MRIAGLVYPQFGPLFSDLLAPAEVPGGTMTHKDLSCWGRGDIFYGTLHCRLTDPPRQEPIKSSYNCSSVLPESSALFIAGFNYRAYPNSILPWCLF
jgi:hypothetical protein